MQLSCRDCLKPEDLCICAEAKQLGSRIHVLILQHPQEPDKDLGTAMLTHLCMPNSTLKVGLSWRNLEHALGQKANPKEWIVLYLGSAKPDSSFAPLTVVNKKGLPLEQSQSILRSVKGIVILDGTWSQAKALWWRNAWLLKLHRAVLFPERRSLYGKLRKEPRGESLSTIESVAMALKALEPKLDVDNTLIASFRSLLDKYMDRRRAKRPATPPPVSKEITPT